MVQIQGYREEFAAKDGDNDILEAFSTLEEQLKTEVTHQNINTVAAVIATLSLILVTIIGGGVIHYFLQGSTSVPIKFLAVASGALMGVALITAVINRVLHSKDKELQQREMLEAWETIHEQCPLQLARFPELSQYTASGWHTTREVQDGKWTIMKRIGIGLFLNLDLTDENSKLRRREVHSISAATSLAIQPEMNPALKGGE